MLQTLFPNKNWTCLNGATWPGLDITFSSNGSYCRLLQYLPKTERGERGGTRNSWFEKQLVGYLEELTYGVNSNYIQASVCIIYSDQAIVTLVIHQM